MCVHAVPYHVITSNHDGMCLKCAANHDGMCLAYTSTALHLLLPQP